MEFRLNEDKPLLIYSPERAAELVKLEQDAFLLCACLLGDCHLMQEVLDYYMTDAIEKFSKYKFFKFNIKKNMKEAHRLLKDNIRVSMQNARSDRENAMVAADYLYDHVKEYLNKLYYSIHLEADKMINPDVVATLTVMEIMYKLIQGRYYSVLDYMKGKFNTNYESFFNHASAENSYKGFSMAYEEYARREPFDMDIEDMPNTKKWIDALVHQIYTTLQADIDLPVEDNVNELVKEAIMELKVS